MVITIANGKGGVGKSTVAINLAGALAKSSEPVLVIDADPQGTSSDWFGSRRELPPERVVHKNLQVTPSPWSAQDLIAKLPELRAQHKFIIIDCGPANDKVMRTALTLSQIVIVPVTPSPYDIRSAKRTVEMINEGKSSAAIKVKPYLLISRKVVGTTLGRDARSALKVFDIPVLKTEICHRIALCESGILGQTIFEYAPSSLSTDEFNTLRKEIL